MWKGDKWNENVFKTLHYLEKCRSANLFEFSNTKHACFNHISIKRRVKINCTARMLSSEMK